MCSKTTKIPELKAGNKPWPRCECLTKRGSQCKNPGSYDKKLRVYYNYCTQHVNRAKTVLNKKKIEQERLDYKKDKNSLENKIRQLTIQNLDLKKKVGTQLPATNQTASTGSVPPSQNEVTIWECYLEQSDEWVPYSKELIKKFNEDQHKKDLTHFKRGAAEYTIDWMKMKQKNNATGYERKIRENKIRHPKLVNEFMNTKHELVNLTPITDQEILKTLEKCLEIKSPYFNPDETHIETKPKGFNDLEFIQAWMCDNPNLQKIYNSYVSRLLDVIPPTLETEMDEVSVSLDSCLSNNLIWRCNERYLLHGTSPTNIMSILKYGFNERYGGTNGGLLGGGIYMAECEKFDMYSSMDPSPFPGTYKSKSAPCRNPVEYDHEELKELHQHLYKHFTHPGDVFYVLVCRVFLGHHIVTKDANTIYTPHVMSNQGIHYNNKRRQLAINPATKLPFNSVVGEKGAYFRHTEYCIMNGNLILPKCIIAYRRKIK